MPKTELPLDNTLLPIQVSLRPYRHPESGDWVDPVDPDAARLLSEFESRKHQVLPFCTTDNKLFVAVLDSSAFDSQVLSKLPYHVVLCESTKVDLMLAQDRVYGLPKSLADNRLGAILMSEDKIHAEDLVQALREQKTNGGRIGSLLSSTNSVTHWGVAEGIARQYGIPLINLLEGQRVPDATVNDIWHVVDESFWTRNLMVPVTRTDTRIVVAMVDPDNRTAIETLMEITGLQVLVFVTGYRDVFAAYTRQYQEHHLEMSREGLLRRQPDDSAHRRFSRGQVFTFYGTIVVLILTLFISPIMTGIVANAIVELFYSLTAIFRLWLIFRSAKTPSEVVVTTTDISELDRSSLPAYTILVPLYREAAVLPTLTRALLQLDYPKDRLDVKFLLEEDDDETIEAAKSFHLPNFIDLVIVPASEPRTKPKACNYGLMHARGEFVVIFDAEDIPEPDQLLKSVSIFRSSDDHLACIQAKLSYFNRDQNMLTRWFTAEYSMWFDLMLPALFSSNLPIPLGGTSNHFRTDVLTRLGAWDPFNVTEDADLGIRLYKEGYRVAIMDSTTFEEANSDFVNWIRQRSRWVKGYMQTWLVHMRHPLRLRKEVGEKGWWGFHVVVGGTPVVLLINPILWGLTSLWFASGQNIAAQFFPSWVYYLAFLNLIIGNFAFTYANMAGMAKRKAWSLVRFAAIVPVYWTFMSIAAWKGLYQLITRPSYWEKTVHGLTTHEYDSTSETLPL